MKSQQTAMNTKDSSHSQDSGLPLWEVLGELEVAVSSNIDSRVGDWLVTVLDPLELGADFISTVLRSAQEAVTRATLSPGAAQSEHIHLIVFHPPGPSPKAPSSWGFFRIEKLESTADASENHDHTIEFYLYVEQETLTDRK